MISQADFRILGSSSSGNCGLLVTAQSRILIDAGFSGRRICAMLEEVGMEIADIDAVFLTHEHADHTQGFRGLSRHSHLKWVANRETYEAISHPNKARCNWSIFETGSRFRFGDLEVETFSIPHDACDPVGYLFSWGGADLFTPYRSIAWVLDIGYATGLVKEKIASADTLVIEANYDNRLLEEDLKRPWSVKQRIMSRHGHLSNQAACELLESMEPGKLRSVLLAHISRDCNSPEAIKAAFSRLIHHPENPFTISLFNPESGRLEGL